MKPALIFAVLLSACTSLVPSTLARLASLSPLEADPGQIEVALLLPEGLRVRPNGATLAFEGTRKDTGETRKGSYVLAERPANPADFGGDVGGSARFYHLAPQDADAMRAQQAVLQTWADTVPQRQRSGSLGVGLDGCAVGAGPAPDALVSVYLRMETGGAFLPLIKNGRLHDLLGKDLMAQIKPCDGAS